MDAKVYKAAMDGDVNLLRSEFNCSSAHPNRVTSLQDTILHIAVKFEKKEVAEMMLKLQPSLAYKKNFNGDTALHIAARLGNLDIVKMLIDLETEDIEANERLVRTVNMKNNTALHEAVEYNQIEVVQFLIEKDPELVMFTNNEGDSPLFMAVDKLHLTIARCILQHYPHSNFRGSNSRNVLHALVIRLNSDVSVSDASSISKLFDVSYLLLDTAIDVNKFIKSRRIFKSNFKFACSIAKDFIKQLIERRVLDVSEADMFGRTPLHYAAYLGNEDVVKQLIDAEISAACKKDKDGMTVLHIAAKQGRVKALKVIMECCPDIWDLKDNQGRTILHHAVESEKIEAVKFIMNKVSMDSLNQQDNAGDTPLHLASRRRNLQIVELMVKDSRVNKTILNNEGVPVMDIILSNTEFSNLTKGRMACDLWNAGCITRKGEANCSRREAAADKSGKKDEEVSARNRQIDEIGNVISVVSTLIATVSFAAAIAVPGGFHSDGPLRGTAVLHGKPSFQVFVLANSLAFSYSTLSLGIQLFRTLTKKIDPYGFLQILGLYFTSLSIFSMFVAFISGSSAVLGDTKQQQNVYKVRMAIAAAGILVPSMIFSFFLSFLYRKLVL